MPAAALLSPCSIIPKDWRSCYVVQKIHSPGRRHGGAGRRITFSHDGADRRRRGWRRSWWGSRRCGWRWRAGWRHGRILVRRRRQHVVIFRGNERLVLGRLHVFVIRWHELFVIGWDEYATPLVLLVFVVVFRILVRLLTRDVHAAGHQLFGARRHMQRRSGLPLRRCLLRLRRTRLQDLSRLRPRLGNDRVQIGGSWPTLARATQARDGCPDSVRVVAILRRPRQVQRAGA